MPILSLLSLVHRPQNQCWAGRGSAAPGQTVILLYVDCVTTLTTNLNHRNCMRVSIFVNWNADQTRAFRDCWRHCQKSVVFIITKKGLGNISRVVDCSLQVKPLRRVKLAASGDVVAGNQLLDDVEPADWAPRALADVNHRRRPSTLMSDDDYGGVVDKRYMRFGRRSSDEIDDVAPDKDKRYMRFGRRTGSSHFHPMMGVAKRYMRFGRRWLNPVPASATRCSQFELDKFVFVCQNKQQFDANTWTRVGLTGVSYKVVCRYYRVITLHLPPYQLWRTVTLQPTILEDIFSPSSLSLYNYILPLFSTKIRYRLTSFYGF